MSSLKPKVTLSFSLLQKLDSLGIIYFIADNDSRIYLLEEKRWLNLPYRNFVGVLVYVCGKEPEWVDVFNWLER